MSHVPAGADTDVTTRSRRRESNTLLAAALTNGPNELIDFVLPLWAGLALGLTPTEVGILLAVEMAVSVIVRPLAGVLADIRERRYVAASGALLYGLSCGGYAIASSAGQAYLAAVLGGLGGGLLWVSVRAIVAERLRSDSAVFPRLLAAQENGSWVAFVTGMMLVGVIGFSGIFAACALACALAAAILLTTPRRSGVGTDSAGMAAAGVGTVARRLRPMFLAVAMTMAAESAVMLLVLLHLQRGFGLEVVQVALVFLPGAIAMGVATEYLHRYVLRFGRRRVLVFASLCGTASAVGVAFAPNPVVVGALWILAGLSWAAMIPIEQVVITEASGDQVGRGMGLYESASLVGAMVGSLAAGVLYDGSLAVACVAAGVVILAGAFVVPWALRRLGVVDVPDAPVDGTGETDIGGRDASETGAGISAKTAGDDVNGATGPEPVQTLEADEGQQQPAQPSGDNAPAVASGPASRKTARQRVVDLGGHLVLYAAAQGVLMLFGLSAAYDLVAGDALAVLRGDDGLAGVADTVYGIGKVWTIVLCVDVLWTVSRLLFAKGRP